MRYHGSIPWIAHSGLGGVLPNFNREAPMGYFSDFDCGVWFHTLLTLGLHYIIQDSSRAAVFYFMFCFALLRSP